MSNPTIVYCCKGLLFVCYAVWSIRSLRRFGYGPIEVIVSSEKEKDFLVSRCPGTVCTVINEDFKGYPAFSYKPLVLTKYIQEIGIQHKGGGVVICDVDILWKHDPAPLFQRFSGLNWVHKITAVNPRDYRLELGEISAPNIGLITTYHYIKRYGLDRYPNFRLNAGLFMLEEAVFKEMLEQWLKKIYALPPKEMLMSEALMSLTYAEMGLAPVCDREDIKHLGVEDAATDLPVFSFNVAEARDRSQFTGYQTAKHYYGDQRGQMFNDVKGLGLDHDNLMLTAKMSTVLRKIRKLPKAPKKVFESIRNKLT